jgi:hypothetical protein
MTTVSMSQHLTDFRERMNNLHAQIAQAYLMALNDSGGARARFIYLSIQIDGLEREHNAWANAYFAEVRSAFGPNSDAERQAAQMSNGVSRWIGQDAIYVLLGNSMAALAGGDVADAHQAAYDALTRCDVLAQQGMDFELGYQRITAWGQVTLVAYKVALDNPGDPQALATARQWAERCADEAMRALNSLLAAQCKAIVAACAWRQDDRMTYSTAMAEAIQIATNSGVMVRNRAGGGEYVPLASYLQSWAWDLQSGADATGDTAHRIMQLNDSQLEGLARAANQPR